MNNKSLHKNDLEFGNNQDYIINFEKGLSKDLIIRISKDKGEPKWMMEHRLKSLEKFNKMDNPKWGPNLSSLNLDHIRFYASAETEKNAKSWDDVSPEIKETFEKLKIPQAERSILAGVGAQYESENIYHSLKDKWVKKGIIFEDFDIALKKYEEIVKKYFMKCVPYTDHKYAALHGAVFSGGTFLYIPKNTYIDEPLQAYFRMNSAGMGQFEHTLIIVEEGSSAEYIEGCSAPKYGENALHAGCVEVFVGKNSNFKYSSVENWSKDTYNLNTKRSIVSENAKMEWVGGNLGSAVTMLYPSSILQGKNSTSNYLGIALSSKNQNQDTGAKIKILADNCTANIKSKSISKNEGISTYRGIVEVSKNSKNSTVNIECDALIFDKGISDTIPCINANNNQVSITHEASAGKVSEELLFFLETRGLKEEEAKGIIVNGFLDDIIKTMPLEYAAELNKLIEMEMDGSF
jgi:Fe-S cluster assembly protein SufB